MVSSLVAALALVHAAPAPSALIAQAEARSGLKLDDLFPRKPFFGRAATGMAWSKDGRYLAYAWLPYGEKGGSDLYVYDAQTKRSTRLTSPDLMARFDRDIPAAEARYRTETAEEDKSLSLDDIAYREWREKRREEADKRTTPLPSYGGVGEIAWSPKGDEMLFTFDGDVFRLKMGDKPTRLTRTAETERSVRWLPNADGYTVERGGGVFRTMFNTGSVEQLNPKLPDGVSYSGYRLAPDGTKLMVTGYKAGPPSRLVDYLSYRDRFATDKKAARDVADDDFKGESYVYLYDLGGDSLDGLTGDGKPWEVWHYSGGKEYQEISIAEEPWSKDSKRFTFGTWRRTAREQTIVVADVATKTSKAVYTAKPDGEHDTPGMADPFFTPDGKRIVALLDATGHREAWTLNPDTGGAEPLTKGDFDVYPLQLTPDGRTLFVRAQKEDTARFDLYRVDMATGAFDRITRKDGFYGVPEISEDGKRIADSFRNWSSPSELVALDGGTETRVTESAPAAPFDKVNGLKPKLFTYLNRLGQTVHGFMFLPPDYKPTDHRPLFLYVYGGPLGVDKMVEEGTFNSTSYLFAAYLARTFGYITATIDPRGVSGYGNAFARANYQAPGKAQVEDLTDGVKWFEKEYGVDKDKVGINGWSFGGFQTQMCLYTAPDVFTLGIAGAGPTEWQNYNNWYSTGVIGPVPNAKPEDLDPYSLTALAKNLRSPLLLLHGMEDTNVLFQDTVKVYRRLLQAGKGDLVELALDPTGDHGMGGDMTTRDRHAIYATFLAKWWGPYEGK